MENKNNKAIHTHTYGIQKKKKMLPVVPVSSHPQAPGARWWYSCSWRGLARWWEAFPQGDHTEVTIHSPTSEVEETGLEKPPLVEPINGSSVSSLKSNLAMLTQPVLEEVSMWNPRLKHVSYVITERQELTQGSASLANRVTASFSRSPTTFASSFAHPTCFL